MDSGNTGAEPGQPPPESLAFRHAWARTFSPEGKSAGLADDLDRFARRWVQLATHLLPLLFFAVAVIILVAVALMCVVVAGLAADIWKSLGHLSLHHLPLSGVSHISSLSLLLGIVATGSGVMRHSRRKRRTRQESIRPMRRRMPQHRRRNVD